MCICIPISYIYIYESVCASVCFTLILNPRTKVFSPACMCVGAGPPPPPQLLCQLLEEGSYASSCNSHFGFSHTAECNAS